MAFAYLLLLLLPAGVVGYIVWDHRRKAAGREAVSAGRMEALLGVATHAVRTDPVPTEATAPARVEKIPTPAVSYVLRARLLTPPQTLLYYLLKTGLPDHVIFSQMSVGSVLDAGSSLAAYAREEQARIFARHFIDFVITDKRTCPVAVVKLTATGDTQQGALASMRSWFAATGIRYVEIDAAALPRKDAVRALVLGDADLRENSDSGAELRG